MIIENSSDRTIARNASMLYLRMFVSMAIGFYTSRIVLQALGVSDYGIYNLVGGIVVLFNVVSTALKETTTRFLTYGLGIRDLEKLKRIFSTTLFIHILLAIIFLVLAETIGLWFVNKFLIIPANRIEAMNWVYQLSILVTTLTIIQVPYTALIISHEKFGTFALIDIVLSLVKLIIAIIVLYSMVDHLILYSILYSLMTVGLLLYYYIYSYHHFIESRTGLKIERTIVKDIAKFSGWSLFNSASLTISQQGFNIILNSFFGTIINAAVGVAGQVQAILYSFIGNISSAFNPQIIKEYANGNYERVKVLIYLGTKFSAVATMLISIPVLCEMDTLMGVWLAKVPQGAVIICQIALVANFFNSFTPLTYTAINADGKIKQINTQNGILFLLRLPIAYSVLYITHSYVLVLLICLYIPILSGVNNVMKLSKIMSIFNGREFLLTVVFPITLIAAFSLCFGLILKTSILNIYLRMFSVLILPTVFSITFSYCLLLDCKSKDLLWVTIKSKLHSK
uniref:Oligosaccharide flippase family protein n=1 Tax=Prevotella sp. GTC17253 TaxID=3236793 RepID=A0AB33IX33_9BACT